VSDFLQPVYWMTAHFLNAAAQFKEVEVSLRLTLRDWVNAPLAQSK
jgi:hypothetical protein